jgi:hypothetical protein
VPLGTDKRESCSRNPFDFGERLRFDAATVTKIKISPGTPNYSQRDDFNVSDALFAHQTATCWRRDLSERIDELFRISICL